MFAQLNKILMIIVLCFVVIFSAPAPVVAQEGVVSDQFTFLQLGETDISLSGPYDSRRFYFGLPADWKVDGDGELELLMTVSFNQAVASDPGVSVVSGGVITVEFNDVVIGVFPLNQVGEVNERLSIPVDLTQFPRSSGRMKMEFILDSGLSCFLNQQMTVIIRSSSRFAFPHTTVAPDTALVNFPRPLYQDSIVQDSVLFVVPDKPSSAELRSVLTLAAGLANRTNGNMLMDLATVGELAPTQLADYDLILVGKPESMPIFSQLEIPAEIVSGKFRDSNQDDGVIQMVNSPWNPANVVLLVGGNTDTGVVKAAQAISTGTIRSGAVSNLSFVESVQADSVNPTLGVYQSLADLGYGDEQLAGYGSNSVSYRFYVPPGVGISSDAYFELAFTHSALADYDRSGIVITLNNRPVGSVRFTDTTAASSTNHVRVSMPSSTFIPGNNLLTVTANLLPRDICSPPSFQGLWAMIWSDSFLNLPLGIIPATATSILDLNTFPAPFSYDSTLGGSIFLLQRDNPASWRTAVQVAGYLGDRAGVALTTLGTFYADDIPESEKANYNVLIVGQPSKLPVITELNATLPAPFINGGDVASQTNLQVAFRVPPSAPAGYLEIIPSPWNPDKVVLAILGNSSTGIRWAGSALVEPLLRSALAGNFAIINGTQIFNGDTRTLSLDPGVIPTPAVGGSGTQAEPIDITPPIVERPSWILPALISSIVLVVLILLWLVVGNRRNRRPKEKIGEN